MKNSEQNRIVDAALELGKEQSWEAVRLYAVAEATSILDKHVLLVSIRTLLSR